MDRFIPSPPSFLGELQGFLPLEHEEEVRRQAFQVVRRFRDNQCRLPQLPDAATIRRMMSFMVGEQVPEEYVPMMLEEMNLSGEDSRALHWSETITAGQRQQFPVVVIGAGVAAFCQAYDCRKRTFRFV